MSIQDIYYDFKRVITRHGVNRTSSGVLKKASLKKQLRFFYELLVLRKNITSDVTESIMLVQIFKIGISFTESVLKCYN